MLLPFSAPRLGLFPCTLVVPPLHGWLSPTGARQAAGRGAQAAAAGTQTHFDEKRLFRSWDPTIIPAWLCLARGENHRTLKGPAAVGKCLQPCYPARSCLTFVTPPATPEGWTGQEEWRFHSWPFQQQQLFCFVLLMLPSNKRWLPATSAPCSGMEQPPAAQIHLLGLT